MGVDGYCRHCGALADVTPVQSGALLCDSCLDSSATPASSAFAVMQKFESGGGITYSQEGDRDPEKGSTDCSGWVHYLVQESSGVDIGNTTSEIYSTMEENGVLNDNIQENDVIFWPGHTGMYLGRRRIKLDPEVVRKLGLSEKNVGRQCKVDIQKMDNAINSPKNAAAKEAWKNFRGLLNGKERYYLENGEYYYEGPVITQASSGVGKVIVTPIRYMHSNKLKGKKPFGRPADIITGEDPDEE